MLFASKGILLKRPLRSETVYHPSKMERNQPKIGSKQTLKHFSTGTVVTVNHPQLSGTCWSSYVDVVRPKPCQCKDLKIHIHVRRMMK